MAMGTPVLAKDNGQITTGNQMRVDVTGVTTQAGDIVSVEVVATNAATAVGFPARVYAGADLELVLDDSATRGNDTYPSIWTAVDAIGGTRTFTVILPNLANFTHVVVTRIPGGDPTLAPRDAVGGGDQGGTTAVSIAATTNTSGTDEASIVLLNWNTLTALAAWPPAGYTSLVNTPNATRSKGVAVAYKTPLTAGAAETATATLGGATDWAGAMVVYKGALPTPGAPPPGRPILMRLRQLLQFGPPIRGIYQSDVTADAAAGGPITIDAPPADLALSAAAPAGLEQANPTPASLTLDTGTTAAALTASPTAPALTLSMAAPTGAETANPAAPLLTLSTGATAAAIVISPAAPALTLGAAAPSASESATAPPASLTLGAGTTTLAEAAKPAAPLLTLGTGATAAAIQPSAAAPALTLGSAAPSLGETANPAAALLTLGAATPTIVSGSLILTAPPATFTLSTGPPSASESLTAPAGSVTLGTATPALAETAKPGAATVTLGTAAPSVALQPSTVAPLLTISTGTARIAYSASAPAALLTLSAAAPPLSNVTVPTRARIAVFEQPVAVLRVFSSPSAATRSFAATTVTVSTFSSPSAFLQAREATDTALRV